MVRRVRRPADKADILTRLTEDKDSAVFSSQIDLMMFAAALGSYGAKGTKFEKSLDPMVFELFSRRGEYEALFHLLGIFRTGDLELLSEAKSDERLSSFEEYANAGLAEIATKLRSGERTALDSVLDLVFSAQTDQTPGKPDIKKIAKDLGL